MAKLLVVDDDTEILDYFDSVLSNQGHEIRLEQRAQRAVGLVDEFHPDLIITDIFMPEMDGYEFIKEIRKNEDHLKILCLSGGAKGFARGQTLAAAKDFGANAVLEKPFERQKLLSTINELLIA